MKSINRIAVALLFALFLAPLAHAIPPKDIKATLKIYRWGSDVDISQLESATARFKKKYPNVTVTIQRGNNNPWSDYINQFMNMVASGEAPDIVAMPIEGIATIASRVPLVDLEEIAKNDAEAKKMLDDVDANLLNGLRWQGKLYFFPTEWNNVVIYYNADMFKEAGVTLPAEKWTWDDLLEAAKKITKKDPSGNITRYGIFISGSNFTLAPWFMTNDTEILTADWHESNVKDPKFAESLKFLYDLIHTHKVAPSFTKNDIGMGAFAAGNVAMFAAGRWPIPELLDSKLNFDVQYFPMKRKHATVFGVGGNCVLKSSKNPELAWEFVKEISGYDFQQELAKSNRAIPSLRSVATTPEQVNVPKNGKIFYDSASTAIPIASPPNFATVEDIFMRHAESYLTDNATLEDTITGMDRELSRAMKRVKW